MSDLPESLDNGGWAYARVCLSKTKEDLEQASLDIHYDAWEGEHYTRDATLMRKIRQAWSDKRKQL